MKFALIASLTLLSPFSAFAAATNWSLCSITEAGQTSPMQAYNMTLKLDEKAVSGSGGCNYFGGEIVNRTDRVFDKVFMTEMACATPDGKPDHDRMDAESRYLRILGDAQTMQEGATSLLLRTADAAELRFVPAGSACP